MGVALKQSVGLRAVFRGKWLITSQADRRDLKNKLFSMQMIAD
jgi:hypothetical protein